ncbi:hypothetical protein C5L14_23225 [Labrys okinawensis]|uniref:Uncharacterized protein n=1 Tax=Labrys okinawensis TaxID=346911 RepID=A0A2S9Q7P2_9HYPH|nr:hypothetical protein [Labrys okinawensis]PRH85355.1 hypothetical protein C5L14_23225 [Labrys okinawensis]
MPTISIPPYPANLADGTNVHVVGITLDGTVPQFIIMRPGENGSVRPDTTYEVFGVSLDDEPESVDG